MKVIAWSQNLTGKARAAGATLVDKQTLFREADVVTVHVVLSGRTTGLSVRRYVSKVPARSGSGCFQSTDPDTATSPQSSDRSAA
jgi:phosphoglycerate dehydrogenase-like enzyme